MLFVGGVSVEGECRKRATCGKNERLRHHCEVYVFSFLTAGCASRASRQLLSFAPIECLYACLCISLIAKTRLIPVFAGEISTAFSNMKFVFFACSLFTEILCGCRKLVPAIGLLGGKIVLVNDLHSIIPVLLCS